MIQKKSLLSHRDAAGTTFIEHPGPRIQRLDADGRRGWFWVPSLEAFPDWEMSTPIRFILDRWLGRQGLFLVHAGAMGLEDGAVLLTGASGKGKSTAVAACLDSALKVLADDLCAVGESGPARIFSIYGSSKLNLDVSSRLQPAGARRDIMVGGLAGKHLFFPGKEHPDKFLSASPLRGVLLCQFTGGLHTRLVPASTADALKVLLASPTLLFPSDRDGQFRNLARLASRVPVYWLETGTDLGQIPETILSWLKQAP